MTQIRPAEARAGALARRDACSGSATAEAITQTSGIAVDLRWPNDVLIGNKKCAGILAQLSDGVLLIGNRDQREPHSIPAGPAADCDQPQHRFRQAIRSRTSPRESLDAMDREMKILFEQGPEPVIRAFTAASSYVTAGGWSSRRTHVITRNDGRTRSATGSSGFGMTTDIRTRILAGGVRPDPCC